jgi:hypothetical protein
LKEKSDENELSTGCMEGKINEMKTSALMLREEYRLRLFENRGLRRILGSKRDKMTGGFRSSKLWLSLYHGDM